MMVCSRTELENCALLVSKTLVVLTAMSGLAVPCLAQTDDPFAGRVIQGDLNIEMIEIGRGEFLMGSPETEPGRSKREGPQHPVKIGSSFALSRTEVSVAQFRQFVKATGYITDAEKKGEGEVYSRKNGQMVQMPDVNWRHDFQGDEADDSLPVIRISWNDANAFVSWLSKSTGRAYRLPSEAEFEYALRAGSNSRYWWGDDSPDERVENLAGARERLGPFRWPVGFKKYSDQNFGPSTVASFIPNPFGLFDMGGNAAEWVADCYTDYSPESAAGGRSKTVESCTHYVFRGASWAYPPPLARSAYRNAAGATHASALVGFRVARSLVQSTANRVD